MRFPQRIAAGRVGQDIAFPVGTTFPRDTLGSVRGKRRRGPRQHGAVEDDLGEIGEEALGGGEEVLGPDEIPGFPGGAMPSEPPRATFNTPPPFPEQAPLPETDEFGRSLAIGKAGLGIGSRIAKLAWPFMRPGTASQTTDEFGLGGDIVGAAEQVGDFDEFGLGLGDIVGGAEQIGDFDIASDLSMGDAPGSGDSGAKAPGTVSGIGLGALNSGLGIAGVIMGDRPDWQKALLSAGHAASLAGSIVPAVGGVTSYVGPIMSAAMLGEGLANRGDAKTQGERIAQDRELVKNAINLGGGIASLINPALAPFALLFGIGAGIDTLARLIWKPKPPDDAESMNQYRSRETARQLAKAYYDAMTKAETPFSLLGMALAGPSLAPHGEFKLAHDTWGSGGDDLSGPDAGLVDKVEEIAATGDPALLREFIQGINIAFGEGGAAKKDELMTDFYRRKLVSLLPKNHPVHQEALTNPDGLFGPTHASLTRTAGIEEFLKSAGPGDLETAAQITAMIKRLEAGETPIPHWQGRAPSMLFRDPAAMSLTDEERAYYIQQLGSRKEVPQGLGDVAEQIGSYLAAGGNMRDLQTQGYVDMPDLPEYERSLILAGLLPMPYQGAQLADARYYFPGIGGDQ